MSYKEACLKVIILPSTTCTRYCFQPLLATPSRMQNILLGVARTACLESLVATTDVCYSANSLV